MNRFDEAVAWQEAIAGDGMAFGKLFDAHNSRVYRHALRLTSDGHDAEDVAAAAFMELWRNRRKVRIVDGSVLPWLLVTASNLALNQGRGLRRYRTFLRGLPREERLADSAEAEAMQRADWDVSPALLAGIRTLGQTDQQLLALVGLEGYPLRAAALAIGLTEHAARSRWQRIRVRLLDHHTNNSLALAVEH
jgi:RNA polymerase sigma-70 factor (ECF subfamily)